MERYGILSALSFVLLFIFCLSTYGMDYSAISQRDKIIVGEYNSQTFLESSFIQNNKNTPGISELCRSYHHELVEFYGTYDQVNNLVEVVWSIRSDFVTYKFGLERSSDSISFTEVGEVKGGANSGTLVTYSLFDLFPTAGKNYYRLKHIDIDGSSHYVGSMSVEVVVGEKASKENSKDKNRMTFYPNPVYDSYFSVQFEIAPGQDTELIISDVWGNIVARIPVAKGTKELTVNSPERKGNYLIEVMVNGELLSRRISIK